MEKEGGYMNRPPLLNGSANYDSWKSKMTAFLRSIDSKVWKVVLTGWEHPTYASKEDIANSFEALGEKIYD
ncbi:gag-protease polyprotein [Trifolium repens]|nr:gag-protease polyprotein [Trifolium repens]